MPTSLYAVFMHTDGSEIKPHALPFSDEAFSPKQTLFSHSYLFPSFWNSGRRKPDGSGNI